MGLFVRSHDSVVHPLRARFDAALRAFIDNLQNSPDTVARAEAIKQDFLEAESVRRFSASLWSDAKDALVKFALLMPIHPQLSGRPTSIRL